MTPRDQAESQRHRAEDTSHRAAPALRERADARRPDERPDERDDAADSDRATDQRQSDTSPHRRRRTLIIAGIVGVLLLIAAAGYGWYYVTLGRYLIETDDAYTQADDIAVSPQVSGYVSALFVTDNQRVRKGDVIARIDDRLYRAHVDQSQADLASALADVSNVEAQIVLQGAVVGQAEAEVKSADAAVTFAQEEMDRYSQLVKTGAGTVQRMQQAETMLRQDREALIKAQGALETERKRLGVLNAQHQQAQAAVLRARAELEQAQINLGYTAITAPIDGVVGDRSVRLGQYVQTGTRLLTLVPMQDVYVVANYKETQVDRMHQGQPVELSVDAYPGVTVHGRVDSLAPGSGSQFALLPPENATGNFTKIVQRVPVKILIDRNDPLEGRLRPGLSVIPTVDTRDTKGKKLAERPSQEGLPPPATPASAAPGS